MGLRNVRCTLIVTQLAAWNLRIALVIFFSGILRVSKKWRFFSSIGKTEYYVSQEMAFFSNGTDCNFFLQETYNITKELSLLKINLVI